jgi:hypothetical protein
MNIVDTVDLQKAHRDNAGNAAEQTADDKE